MRLRLALCSLFVLASTTASFASPHVRRGPTAARSFRAAHSRAVAARPTAAARVSMAPERATEIQSALIKAGYLTGSPSGQWDAESQAAMQKLQLDSGLPTKFVPDARALIKLGLGPNAPASSVAAYRSAPSDLPAANQ